MAYNAETRCRFESPATSGQLQGPTVFRGAAGQAGEGTWVQFDVRMACGSAPAEIADARFRAFGCPHVIAAADLMCEFARGRAIAIEPLLTVSDLRCRLDAPIEKLGRLLIVEDAWVAVMRAASDPPF